MFNLNTPVGKLYGVGPKLEKKLNLAGLITFHDLLFYYPRAWEDFRNIQPIAWLRIGEEVTIKGKIQTISQEKTPRKRMAIVTVQIADDSGAIKAVWFNQPYLARMFRPNLRVTLHGKIDFNWRTREKILSSPVWVKEERIVPVYSEVSGIPSRFFERLINSGANIINDLVDWLPDEIKEDEDLIDLTEALKQIHQPASFEALGVAKKRLAFDELFLIALSMVKAKTDRQKESGLAMKIDEQLLKKFVTSLPYPLTNAQKKSAWEIIQNLAKTEPMNRLLEGDVGSGKTVVAAMAALVVIQEGWQVAWMAPTEILAKQHYQTVQKLMKPFKIKTALMTGSVKENHNLAQLIIGTHALIQEKISYPKLGLVIVDEQHRFGVAQRALLKNQNDTKIMPHFLSMTATPIPRTLALALYGDLDISIIDEMPPGRQKITTRAIGPEARDEAYQFIRKQIKAGRQAFVICPLIEGNNQKKNGQLDFFEAERKSAVIEYQKLSKLVFPDLKIGLLHGKLRPKEKERVMTEFREKKLDILVSTAVVEVGIDIPNATVMMIEGAERFGLAQLHQFRGRVGRGKHQSYCLLFAENWSVNTKARLEAMVECDSGFELAERDLKLRGPGELIGLRQSGLPDLKMASLTDIIMVKKARRAAEKMVKLRVDKFPLLWQRLAEFQKISHLE